MAKTPNTHPEQIVDKNGKVTTVHKSNGKAIDSRVVGVSSLATDKTGMGRISGLSQVVARRAEESGDTLGSLRETRDAVRRALSIATKNHHEQSILRHDPDIRSVKLVEDHNTESGMRFVGAYDRKGDLLIGEGGSAHLATVSAELFYHLTGNRTVPEIELYIDPRSDEPLPGLDKLPIDNPSYEELLDAFEVTESLIQTASRSKLESDLRAINPYIDGFEYEAELDTGRSDGRWHQVQITSLLMFGKPTVVSEKSKEGREIVEVLLNIDGNELVPRAMVGSKGTVMFSENQR